MKRPDTSRKTIVGIVCLNAYPVLDVAGAGKTVFGGMETRAVTFAKGLVINGKFDVKFFVGDFDQKDRVIFNDIVCLKYQKLRTRAFLAVKSRFQKLRDHKKLLTLSDFKLLWTLPLLILYKVFPGIFYPMFWRYNRCDVVCCFGVNRESADTIADCKFLGVSTVLFIAANSDLSESYSQETQRFNKYDCPNQLCYFALKNANHIVVQTQSQSELLRNRFGRSADVLPNPISMATSFGNHAGDYVLWIGRTDTFHKQPSLCLELAKRCPKIKFLMILNNTDSQIFQNILETKPTNVDVIESVPFHEMSKYFQEAKLLLSTSSKEFEGFPNTFLQAACHGLPIASLEVDPDGLFCGCGGAVNANGNIDTLAEYLYRLDGDAALRDEMGQKIKNYALGRHGLIKTIAVLEEILSRTHSSKNERTCDKKNNIFVRYT